MQTSKYILLYLIPLFLYAGAIAYSSTISDFPTIRGVVTQEPVPEGAWTGDEIEHILAYAFLAFLFYRAVKETNYQHVGIAATILFCASFGLWNEFLQSSIAERSFSMADMFWNLVGSLFVKLL